MIKTESEIERDFYAFAKASALGQALRGNVYRAEMRPPDSSAEDLIVKFLAGSDEQVQTGIVILNLYVPDIPCGPRGRMSPDSSRIAELQSLVRDFIAQEGGAEYLLKADATPKAEQAEGIQGQHIIRARIYFQRITV